MLLTQCPFLSSIYPSLSQQTKAKVIELEKGKNIFLTPALPSQSKIHRAINDKNDTFKFHYKTNQQD